LERGVDGEVAAAAQHGVGKVGLPGGLASGEGEASSAGTEEGFHVGGAGDDFGGGDGAAFEGEGFVGAGLRAAAAGLAGGAVEVVLAVAQ